MIRPRGRTPHQAVRGEKRPYSNPNAMFPRRRPIFSGRNYFNRLRTKNYRFIKNRRANSLSGSEESRRRLSREIRGRDQGHNVPSLAPVPELCGTSQGIRTFSRRGNLSSEFLYSSKRVRGTQGSNDSSIPLSSRKRVRPPGTGPSKIKNRSLKGSYVSQSMSGAESESLRLDPYKKPHWKFGAIHRRESLSSNLLALGSTPGRFNASESERCGHEYDKQRIASQPMDVSALQKHEYSRKAISSVCENVRTGILEEIDRESCLEQPAKCIRKFIPDRSSSHRPTDTANSGRQLPPIAQGTPYVVFDKTRLPSAPRCIGDKCQGNSTSHSSCIGIVPAGLPRVVSRSACSGGARNNTHAGTRRESSPRTPRSGNVKSSSNTHLGDRILQKKC